MLVPEVDVVTGLLYLLWTTDVVPTDPDTMGSGSLLLQETMRPRVMAERRVVKQRLGFNGFME